MKFAKLDWPLMHNNITKDDRDVLIEFLKTDPILTNGPKVLEFEEAWSKWLGVKYSVFVNSGASANLLTMSYLRLLDRGAKVIVPTLTWVSDIASVIQNEFNPEFVDIDPKTLAMPKIPDDHAPRWIFLTHVMGLPAELPAHSRNFLIEDCCESHGATIDGQKVGTFGRISNFSFYFAHHMTTIEGGMICTNDSGAYENIRMLRSHGMVREMRDPGRKARAEAKYPNVHPSFLFWAPAYNARSTEINAVLGLNQLKRLDENIAVRKKNFDVFLNELSPVLYRTDLATQGASPYGLLIILNEPNIKLRNKIEKLFTLCGVEYRRGLSGGGNQLRQPYLKNLGIDPKGFPEVEHITDFSWYIGNYPGIEHKKIKRLCKLLNQF